jgi:hypothetical protein
MCLKFLRHGMAETRERLGAKRDSPAPERVGAQLKLDGDDVILPMHRTKKKRLVLTDEEHEQAMQEFLADSRERRA